MFSKTFLVALLASLVSANPAPQNNVDVAAITSAVGALPVASQAALLETLSSYQASLASDPMFTSAFSVLATAVPASDVAKAAADPSGYLQSALTATATPSWYSALPTQYQSYFESIGSAQLSIVNAATAGAKGGNNKPASGSATATATGSGTATGSAATTTSNAAQSLGKGVKMAAAGMGGLVAGLLAL